jgi:hypothetical protein
MEETIPSVREPEIPENFGLPQSFFLRPEIPSGDFYA